MGDPLDFFIDEGGWPYPDDAEDDTTTRRAPEPIDLRSDADDDLVALHALSPRSLAELSDEERAAVIARFGLESGTPMTMVELRSSLGLSRERTRIVLTEGLDKLRIALADGRGSPPAARRGRR